MSTGYEGQVESHKHTFAVADIGDFDLDERCNDWHGLCWTRLGDVFCRVWSECHLCGCRRIESR